MIDTVTVRAIVTLSEYQESRMAQHIDNYPDETSYEKYQQRYRMPNGTTIYVKFCPENNKFEKPSLNFQVSLPKALFGDNRQMITNTDQVLDACEKVNQFLRFNTPFPPVKIEVCPLYRLDLAYNHFVQQDVSSYLFYLRDLFYPRHKSIAYANEGVEFRTKSNRVIFYNKDLERGIELPNTILREEVSVRGGDDLCRFLKMENVPTLMDITPEMAANKLNHTLDKLGLNQTICCNPIGYQAQLIAQYGRTKGSNIYHHWIELGEYGRDTLLSQGISQRTYENWRKEVLQANLPPYSPGLKYPLSPLNVDFEKNISLKGK